MALSDIALCARALMKIGAMPIASFLDGTVEAEVAGAFYTPTRDAVLSAYPWSFATRQSRLNRLLDAPVDSDYRYGYALPVDLLRVLSAGSGGRGRGIDYRLVEGGLLSDAESVTLVYVARVPESVCPPYFESALMARLAAEFCAPVTGGFNRAKLLADLAEAEMRRARLIDAQQDTPQAIEGFPLLEGR